MPPGRSTVGPPLYCNVTYLFIECPPRVKSRFRAATTEIVVPGCFSNARVCPQLPGMSRRVPETHE